MKRLLALWALILLYAIPAQAGSYITNPKFTLLDDNGELASGACVYFYEPGTTTKKTVYTDVSQSVAASNPITLDSRGEYAVFGTGSYKIVANAAASPCPTTPDDVIWSADNVFPNGNYVAGDTATVASIAELRGVTGTDGSSAIPLGWYAVGDGGGGPLRTWDTASTCTDNGGNCVKPTVIGVGDPGRWVGSSTYSWSAEEFGAKGDGTTDDVARWQAACDAAYAAGGGTIYGTPGKTYLIDSVGKTVLTFDFGFTIGSNTTINLRGATIKAGANLPLKSAAFGNASGDTAYGVRTDKNIKITNGIIDGSGRSYPAWDVNTDPPTYDGLAQTDARGHMGLFFSVENITISDLEIKNHDSLTMGFGGCKNLLVDHIYGHDCGKIDDASGVLWISKSFPNSTHGDTIKIVDSIFENLDRYSFQCGIDVDNVYIKNVTIKNTKESGMFLPGPATNYVIEGGSIDGVEVSDTSGSGIEINGIEGAIISGMSISNTGRSSIVSVGLTNAVITGNMFRNYGQTVNLPTGPQTYANGTAGTPMSDNLRSGILLFTGDTTETDNVRIADNVFMDDQTPETGKYNVYLGQFTATPLAYGKLTIANNDMRTGNSLDTVYKTAAANASTEMVVRDNDTSDVTSEDLQLLQLSREEITANNTPIGNIEFFGHTPTSNVKFVSIQGNAWDITDTVEQGRAYIKTMKDGTLTTVATFGDDGFKLFTGTDIKFLKRGFGTLDFASIAAGGYADLPITVTGATTTMGAVVSVGLPTSGGAAGIVYTAFVSAADTVTMRANNYTTGAIDPASATYNVLVTGF
jgi:hypothetical protein